MRNLPQIQEVLEKIEEAREYSIEMLHQIEKLSVFANQIQGRHTFIQQCLREQEKIFALLSEQNPQMEIFKSSKDQIEEALIHANALSQANLKSLEILDMSAESTQEQEQIQKASVLLHGVIHCLDMLMGDRFAELGDITNSNQQADQELNPQHLKNLTSFFHKDKH